MSRLSVRFGVSRKTAGKGIGRYRAAAEANGVSAGLGDLGGVLADCSRWPLASAGRPVAAMEELVLGLRGEHPA